MGRAIRKLAVFFSSFAAVFAVIGSGFAAWIFFDKTSASPHISVLVTEAEVEEGAFSYDQLPALVVLDGGSYGGVYNTQTGINFYKEGYSGYDTVNDKANYEYNDDGSIKKDENGNPIKKNDATLPEEVLLDTSFTIYYESTTEIQSTDLFGIRVEVTGFLTDYITHSSSYYSYGAIVTDTGDYYLDLKALATNWGKYTAPSKVEDGEGNIVYRCEFQLTTSLLNTFFSYKEIKKEDGTLINGIERYRFILDKLEGLNETERPTFAVYLLKASV